jgi:hypothetical protein
MLERQEIEVRDARVVARLPELPKAVYYVVTANLFPPLGDCTGDRIVVC